MIERKSRYEISIMRSAGKIVAEVLLELKAMTKPGVSTAELDERAEKIILKHGAIPTFKGYHGFPATICASVNNEVVHGIPSKECILHDGDIISLDVGATYKGLVGDSAITVGVGSIKPEVQELLDFTKLALERGIEKVISGLNLQEVSGAIEDTAKEKNYGVVKQYGGHGVGRKLHEDPFVYNFRTGNPGPVMKAGMVLALEPMFNLGTGEVHTLDDKWTVVTNDAQPSAHFEHTVLVGENAHEILTLL